MDPVNVPAKFEVRIAFIPVPEIITEINRCPSYSVTYFLSCTYRFGDFAGFLIMLLVIPRSHPLS